MIEHIKRLEYYEINPNLSVPSGFLDDFQSHFSVKLPQDYDVFLSEFPRNGGFSGLVVSPGIEISDSVPDGLYEIFEFWGYAAKNELSLYSVNDDTYDQRTGWLWIGSSSSSARFYLGVMGSNFGHITFVDNYDTSEKSILVSRSFTDFIMNAYAVHED